MASTVQSSISPTGTSSPVIGNFTWSNFPSTVDACTSPTFYWDYSGPAEILVSILIVSDPAPSAQFVPTVLTDGIDVATVAHWTWPTVDVAAGEYVVEAIWPDSTTVALPMFVIANGTDTSCLASAVTGIGAIPADGPLPTMTTTPSPEPSVPPIYMPQTDVQDSSAANPIPIMIITVASPVGFLIFIITIAVYRARRLRRRQLSPSSPGRRSTEAAHSGLPLSHTASTTQRPQLAERGTGGTRPFDPFDSTDSPLVPNRRPPSSIISEPNSPVAPPYMPHHPHAHTHEQVAGSIIEASTIGSRISVAPSYAPSTAELMGTFYSYPPSYVTNTSLPPSYATGGTQVTTPSRSAHTSSVSSV